MKKYLLILFALILNPLATHAESENNDFEAELRQLEAREMAQEEKADALVQKIDIIDSVTEQNAAVLKEELPETKTFPISQEIKAIKKIRRIPSR